MVSKYWRIVSWPIVVSALSAPLLMNCGAKMPGGGAMPGAPGGAPGGIPGVGSIPGAQSNCPDVANLDAIATFDWGKEFKLDAAASGKIKGGVLAAANLKGLSMQIDGDLKAACGGLAKDLGATGDFATGQAACEAAIKVMGEVRAKLGASAKATLDVVPPKCSASIDAMAECAGKCDATVKPGELDIKCEGGELSGKCDAKCEGKCSVQGAAKCEGTCDASCEAGFSGTCGGTCEGKCDGKDTKGECKGKCEGKCEGAVVKGECKGKCGGTCEMKAAASCSGECHGGCSAKFKEPKCTGKVDPPKVSAECKASCNAQVSGKLECTPARVALKITGAADAKLTASYKGAIEKNLPGILKIAIGMKDRAEGVAASVQGVVEGAEGSVKAAVSGGPVVGAALTACVANPFKGAIDAAASIKASVKVSVDVKASASASGSAGGKAG